MKDYNFTTREATIIVASQIICAVICIVFFIKTAISLFDGTSNEFVGNSLLFTTFFTICLINVCTGIYDEAVDVMKDYIFGPSIEDRQDEYLNECKKEFNNN